MKTVRFEINLDTVGDFMKAIALNKNISHSEFILLTLICREGLCRVKFPTPSGLSEEFIFDTLKSLEKKNIISFRDGFLDLNFSWVSSDFR